MMKLGSASLEMVVVAESVICTQLEPIRDMVHGCRVGKELLRKGAVPQMSVVVLSV